MPIPASSGIDTQEQVSLKKSKMVSIQKTKAKHFLSVSRNLSIQKKKDFKIEDQLSYFTVISSGDQLEEP